MNIVDALVVTLGLDSSGFNLGRKDVDKSLKDTKENADKAAKEMEAKGKVAAQFFGQIRNQVIALAATFTAGAGLKAFVENITVADAAAGRTARNIGVATEVLSAWQGVAERAGGSSAGITGSMQGLSQQFQQLALTGQSAVVPYFRAVGVALADSNGKIRPMSELLLDLSDRLSKMDPARAQAIGRGLGMDEGTVNVLMQGRAAIQGLLVEQQKLGAANAQDAAAAAQRQASFRALGQASEDLGRKLLTTLTPAINALVRGLTAMAEWFSRHPTIFAAFATTIMVAAAALTTALTILSFKGFLGLISTLTKVPAAAAAATTAMEGAAAASSASTVGMLAGLAKSAALLAAAGAVGYAIGTMIYSAIEDTKVADKLGRWIAKTMAFFGSSTAKEALDIEERAAAAQRLATGKVSTPKVAAGEQASPSAAPMKSDQAQRDMDKLVGMGWTREQAAGIAANIQRESGGRENAIGDSGQAFGLAQWHPDRQQAFQKWSGKNIRDANRDEQLAFINFELREGSERRAGAALSKTSDAASAARVVSSQYERPADTSGEAAKRAGMAVSLLAPGPKVDRGLQMGAGAAVAANTTNNTSSSTSHAETHIGEVHVTLPNAKDAQSVATGLGPEMRKNFSLAAQADYSLS